MANDEDLVEVFHVFKRKRRSGHAEYAVGSNLNKPPGGFYRVQGTGTMSNIKALTNLALCQNGKFWGLKKKERREMADTNAKQRKAISQAFIKSKYKSNFDWTKIQRLTRDF